MHDLEHDIHPGVGIGPLRLGMDRDTVRALLGDPAREDTRDYGEGDIIHDWEYEALRLSLSFASDHEDRLSCITTEADDATLSGEGIVGLTETQLLETHFGDLGPPVLDDDFEEFGKDFLWDDENLSCWLSDGYVDSVSVMPLYDPSGDIPQWPTAEA